MMRNTPKITRHQIVILIVCVGIFALGQFHRASGSIFTPILMDQFALPAVTVGGLVSAMFFATILAQVPFGAALDRSGPRPVLTVCILTVAVGTGLFAVAQSFETAFLSRVLIGVGLAAMGAATHVIIARHFAQRDFGFISGLVVTLGGIGGLLGTYPLALALERLPWSLVFGGVAVFTTLLAVFVFSVVAPGDKSEPGTQTRGGSGYLLLLRQTEFLKILALGVVTYAPITTITGLWGGPFLQDAVGLSAQQAGAVLFMLFSATLMAGFVFGVLDRRARSRRRIVLTAATLSTLSLILLAVLPISVAPVSIGLLVIMVFCQQFYIPLGAHMRRVVPDHLLGRAATLLSVVSVAAIPAMQIGFGAALDLGAGLGWSTSDQYRAAFAAMAALVMVCTLVYATARQVNDAASSDTRR